MAKKITCRVGTKWNAMHVTVSHNDTYRTMRRSCPRGLVCGFLGLKAEQHFSQVFILCLLVFKRVVEQVGARTLILLVLGPSNFVFLSLAL